jgi:protein-L-isoaspartate(D-aspartate) O-methyltransferase
MMNRCLAAMDPAGRAAKRTGNPALRMVERQVEARGINDPRILAALRSVPRDLFVPGENTASAWDDRALPIGEGQTISQPYIVALMTSLLNPRPGDRILEVGTGSGYQAAVLASMGAQVDTIEIIPALAREAAERLALLGYSNVRVHTGDGSDGLEGKEPYDGIIITCATGSIPDRLAGLLAENARLIVPLGTSLSHQNLTVATRLPGGSLELEKVAGVVFVPMTGPRGMASTREASA